MKNLLRIFLAILLVIVWFFILIKGNYQPINNVSHSDTFKSDDLNGYMPGSDYVHSRIIDTME